MRRSSPLTCSSQSSSTTTTTTVVVSPPQDDDEQQSESLRRRRQQYRVYQRRRRNRQQATTFRLEREVEALIHSIAGLQHRSLHLFRSRGTPEGAPARLVATFYRVFEHGLVPSQRASQDQFLRSMMASNVQGPDYHGVDALVEQWRLYETCLTWLSYTPRHTDVLTLDESTVVTVDVLMAMRLDRSGVESLFPGTNGDEFAVQQLLSSRLDVHGSVRFEFDSSGVVTWCGADMDFISGLQPVLGSLARVNDCIAHSGISLITGRILTDLESESTARASQRDSRHDVEFLLT